MMMKVYILEVDVDYPTNLLNLHDDLPFEAERKKIKKCNKLICNIYDKENYVVHIKSFKTSTKSRISTEKVHRVIQFNQKAWLEPNIKMNPKLTTEVKKMILKKTFLN